MEADRFTRAGSLKWLEPMLFLGSVFSEKILGIIGLGRIGGRWQKNARWFQCKIIYYDQVRNEEIEKSLNIEYFDLETLLKMADFVGIHVPLLPSTRAFDERARIKINEAIGLFNQYFSRTGSGRKGIG